MIANFFRSLCDEIALSSLIFADASFAIDIAELRDAWPHGSQSVRCDMRTAPWE